MSDTIVVVLYCSPQKHAAASRGAYWHNSIPGRDRIFLFVTTFKPSVESTQPLI